MNDIPDPRAAIVATLSDTTPHIRRISDIADDSICPIRFARPSIGTSARSSTPSLACGGKLRG
jgi:hypothetical protein